MIRDVKPGFQVLTGSAPTLAPSFAVGCAAPVLAFANAAPYATVSIWKRIGRVSRKRRSTGKIGLVTRLSRHHQAWRARPEVCDGSCRYYGGPPRLPLTVPCPAAKKEIEEASPTCEVNVAHALISCVPRCTRANASGSATDRLDHRVGNIGRPALSATSAVLTFPSAKTFATARSTEWRLPPGQDDRASFPPIESRPADSPVPGGDIRRRTVHRLEHGWKAPRGIQIGARR